MGHGQVERWKLLFFPLAWAGHVGLGMALGLFGPTQPYLAKKVSTSIDTINFIWTGRSLGFVLTSILTGFVFKPFFRTSLLKLIFLGVAQIVTGLLVVLVPLASSFPLLILLVTLFGMSLGCFDTADNSLMVYTMGPVKSRPFTQSLHACVGVGFVLGSLLVQPFLPVSNTGSSDVCLSGNSSTSISNFTDTPLHEFVDTEDSLGDPTSPLRWPYLMIGAWLVVTGLGLMALGCSAFRLPSFYDDEENREEKTTSSVSSVPGWLYYLVAVYFFYVFSCGIEGFFQSMTYTYALCGPLAFQPWEANILSMVYLASFLIGRLSGIFISRKISPTALIFASLSGCVLAALLLCGLATFSKPALYLGVLLMGFSISFQFASGISWTAQLINVTGSASFIFFMGGFSGFLSFPPLAGAIITMEGGQENFFYLTLATSLVQTCLFAGMHMFARKQQSGK